MRITVLTENTSINNDIGSEHGLSLYIETKGNRILFDMGQTKLFAENAKKLGVDLSMVDFAVVSHGHYDHGGGLTEFLRINKKAPVYISKYAFDPHYNGKEKYIGLDGSLKNSQRLIFTDDLTVIDENFKLLTCNDREKKFDLGSFGLNMMKNSELLPDDFRHEQYLFIKENGKNILISGCSHKGILNIVDWFKPHVLIGFETEYYTCHCTGMEQFEFMKKCMKKLHYISAGAEFSLTNNV